MPRPRAFSLLAVAILFLSGAFASGPGVGAASPLPNREGTFKFSVLGDFGTGAPPQYRLAKQMDLLHTRFKFSTVITVGDNLYGTETARDFRMKFSDPYGGLLKAGVRFYAALGNHDSSLQLRFEPFHMGGRPYYTFRPSPGVRFFVLDSTHPSPPQIEWLEQELRASDSEWKIVVSHHPFYSSAQRHGSSVGLRELVEPLLVKYNVSIVFSGHDHVYERIKPQKEVSYFVVGSGGQLRAGTLDPDSSLTANGFDQDRVFLAAEIVGDQLYFNAISSRGPVVDSGAIERRRD